MNMFIDTEFTCLPWEEGSRLISIGICLEDGTEYYACSSEFPLETASDFVVANIIPHLPDASLRKSEAEIGEEICDLLLGKSISAVWAIFPTLRQLESFYRDGDSHKAYAQYADWDFQLLKQLMGALPADFPECCNDLTPLVTQLGIENLPRNECRHDALQDARWNYSVWRKFLDT